MVLTPYQNELLKEAVRQEVALSILGPEPSSTQRHSVMAIRTRRGGVDRQCRKPILLGWVVNTLRYWLVAPLLAFL